MLFTSVLGNAQLGSLTPGENSPELPPVPIPGTTVGSQLGAIGLGQFALGLTTIGTSAHASQAWDGSVFVLATGGAQFALTLYASGAVISAGISSMQFSGLKGLASSNNYEIVAAWWNPTTRNLIEWSLANTSGRSVVVTSLSPGLYRRPRVFYGNTPAPTSASIITYGDPITMPTASESEISVVSVSETNTPALGSEFAADISSASTSYFNVNGSGQGGRYYSCIVTSNASWHQSPRFLVMDMPFAQNWFASAQTVSGLYIQFDFWVPKKITEMRYIQDLQASQGTWKVQGSSDASTWTDIGSSFAIGPAETTIITALNGNTTQYRYYRLLGLSGTTSTVPFYTYFQFQIEEPYGQDYANDQGVGNRTSTCTVTGSSGLINGTPSTWVDGADTNAAFFNNVALSSSVWFAFDFGSVSHVIDEVTMFQQNATAEGTWQFQGSNDGVSWTNVGSTGTLGGATQVTFTGCNGNTTAYTKYRFLGVSGSTSNSPWIYEFLFRTGELPVQRNVVTTGGYGAYRKERKAILNSRLFGGIQPTRVVHLKVPVSGSFSVTTRADVSFTAYSDWIGAFQSDGQASVSAVASQTFAAAFQMDGQASASIVGNYGVASEAVTMAGLGSASFAGNYSVASDTVAMAGQGSASFVGLAPTFGTVTMDGAASAAIAGNYVVASDTVAVSGLGTASFDASGPEYGVVQSDGHASTTFAANYDVASDAVSMAGQAAVSIVGTAPLYGDFSAEGQASATFAANYDVASDATSAAGHASVSANPTGPEYGAFEADGQASSSTSANYGVASDSMFAAGHGSVSVDPTGPEYGTFQASGQASSSHSGNYDVASDVVSMSGQASTTFYPTGPAYAAFEADGAASSSTTGNYDVASDAVAMSGQGSSSYVPTGPVYVSIQMDGQASAGVDANFVTHSGFEADGFATNFVVGTGPVYGILISAGQSNASAAPTGPEYATFEADGLAVVSIIGNSDVSGVFEADGRPSVVRFDASGPEYGVLASDGRANASAYPSSNILGAFFASGVGSVRVVGSGPEYGIIQCDGSGTFFAIPSGPEYGTMEADGTASTNIVGIGPTFADFSADGRASCNFMWMTDIILIGQFQCDGKAGLPVGSNGTLAGNTGGGSGSTGGAGGTGSTGGDTGYTPGVSFEPENSGGPIGGGGAPGSPGSGTGGGVGSGVLPSGTGTYNLAF